MKSTAAYGGGLGLYPKADTNHSDDSGGDYDDE